MRDTSVKPVEDCFPIFRIEWTSQFYGGKGVVYDKDGPRIFPSREHARQFLDDHGNRLRRKDPNMTFRTVTINSKADDELFLSQINREQTS